jgi:hypothetical protein
MHRRSIPPALALAALLLTSAAPAQDAKPARPKANADDVKSLNAIVAALYDVISGPKEKARDWDRFRSLFAPDARLIPVATRDGASRARSLTVEDYAKLAAPAFERDGFFESEVSRKAESFGAIAHVFSTYESRHAKGDAPFARGINSIQLLNEGDRWSIVTIYWDSERPGLTIPAEYLPKK